MSKPLHIADDLFVSIKAECKERDIHPTDYLRALIETIDLNAVPPPVDLVDTVTEYMMARLDHGQQELLTVLCKENHSTPLEYILGYCHLAFEQGNTAFLARPKDDVEINLLSNAALASQNFLCKRSSCGIEFVPLRDGQLYCSDTCGQIEHSASVALRAANRHMEPSEWAPTLRHTTPTMQMMPPPESEAIAALTAQIQQLTALVTNSSRVTSETG